MTVLQSHCSFGDIHNYYNICGWVREVLTVGSVLGRKCTTVDWFNRMKKCTETNHSERQVKSNKKVLFFFFNLFLKLIEHICFCKSHELRAHFDKRG